MKPGKMPMGGGLNMNALMKQAQKMQADVAKLQEELNEKEYTATAGGGAVSATVKGKTLSALSIQPEVVDPEDIDMLADLIMAAVNSAMQEADETYNREMQKVTGGMAGLM